jgi:guanylate kinase
MEFRYTDDFDEILLVYDMAVIRTWKSFDYNSVTKKGIQINGIRIPNQYFSSKSNFREFESYFKRKNKNLKAVVYYMYLEEFRDYSFLNNNIAKSLKTVNLKPYLIFSASFRIMDSFGKKYISEVLKTVASMEGVSLVDDDSNYKKYFPTNFEGFVNFNNLGFNSTDPSFPFMNFLVSNALNKLYVVVSPPGFGKSTLIDEMRYLCVKPMPKVTTRQYRNLAEAKDPSIESIPLKDFKSLEREGSVVGAHNYKDNLYGFWKDKVLGTPSTYRNHIVDSCDFDSAMRLREEFPDLVRLVTLFPSLSFAGFGLEERLKGLSHLADSFESFQEELEYLKRNKITVVDTKNRLENVVAESRKFEKYLPYFDIVLKGYDMQSNINALLLEMAK